MKKDVERNTVEVKRRALALGFDAVGIATLEANAHAAELDRWLAAGYAGTMTYLYRQAAKRKEPARIMPAATAAVVTLTNYYHGSADPAREPGEHPKPKVPVSAHPGLASGVSSRSAAVRVAQYAQSADYHRVLGHRLERLAAAIRALAHRADFTADERSLVGDWLFGCDICQDVCPWNVQFARATADPDLAPRSDLAVPDPHAFLELDEETFVRRYGDTALERPGRCGMRRNAAATLAPKPP